MKKNPAFWMLLFAVSLLSSCQAIGDIFKAGVWVGVILVVAVIALILWIVNRSNKG